MESTTEASQSGGLLKTKPTLPPKPGVTPKPFSLQKKSTIRSISAPKTALKAAPTPKSPTALTEKSEAKSCLTPAVTPPAKKLPQPTSTSAPKTQPAGVPPKSQPEATKASEAPPQDKNGLGSETRAPDPATKITPPKEEPKSESVQKNSVIQTNHKTPTKAVASSEQKDGEEKQSDTSVSVTQKIEESSSNSFSANNSAYLRGSTRKRLPKELTSKFESGGVPLPPQPSKAISKPITKDNSDKPDSTDTQQSPATPEPPVRESDADAPNEDFSGGNSIKKRISLLFDSVSKPEVPTKREEPEVLNGIGGVKEQIKNWAAETGPEDQKVEKKPHAVARVRSKGFEPVAEKSTETSRLEVPPAEETPTQPVDTHSTVSSPTRGHIEPPKEVRTEDKSLENATETPAETDKPKKDDVQPQRNHVDAAEEKVLTADSALKKKKKKANRRSVRFGTVVADDGGPPVMLGPEPESSEDEKQKEDAEVKIKEEAVASMPVYRRVGILQRNDEETQIQEPLKHQQFELKEEESKQARLKMEEEQKQIEEGEAREKEKAKQKELEKKQLEEEMERLREEIVKKERQMELLRQRQIEEEGNKERFRLEEEKRKEERMREERERQRQKEEEERLIQKQKLEEERREKELELMRQRKEEEERLRQEQMEKQKLRQEAEEKERLKRLEEEEKNKRRELEEQRTKELELLRQRKEEEERLRQEQLEKQKLKQEAEEKERLRRLEEEEMIKKRKLEEQRMKELELLRQRKEEEERLRQEQMEKQKLRQEAEEKERLRRLEEEEKKKRRELEEQRTKELELLRQRKEEEERLRQEQLEKQKLRQEAEEKERLRRLEEEERLRWEDEERKRRELERKMLQEKEQEEERKRIEIRKIQMEKEKAEELKRKIQEDLERQRAEEPSKKLRTDEANDKRGQNLISFDADDYSQKSEPLFSPSSNLSQNTKSPIDIIYDDFSVQNPLLDVDFDDFSVKPRRWTPLPRLETAPISSRTVEPVNKDNRPVSFDSEPRKSQQKKLPEQAEKQLVPTPAPDSPKRDKLEQLLIDLGVKEKVEEQRPLEDQFEPVEMKMEEEDERDEEEDDENMENCSDVEMKEDKDEERDHKKPQVNSYSTNGEDKPIETLFHSEPPQQDGISEQMPKPDSPTTIPDPVPDVSSEDVDCIDSPREPDLAPFPEISTPLLDTSTQRSKAVLSRRRTRSRPSRSLRLGSIKAARVELNMHDGEKGAESKENDSDSDEEPPKSKPASSPSTSTQKVPMFPGLSPAALLAGIKKKTSGGAAGAGEGTAKDRGGQEKESQNKEVASSPSQISGSPRLPAHLAGAARVLPPNDSKEGSPSSSPAWLKELKSKKRMSQHNGET